MLARVSGRAMAVAVAVILLTATFFLVRDEPETKTVTAHFSRAVSVYEGSQVRILGVPVGTVTAVVPEGNSVRVEMEYAAEHEVPADAKAVIVTPTLVADRFVQLTPAYTGGDVMEDGADIELEETGTPVELDRIYSSLRDLSEALGPNGVNEDGSLDTLLHAGRGALEGQGARGNRMILDMSRAAETFGQGSGQLFGTVRHLSEVTSVLAENDAVVSRFIRDLAAASAQLSGERQELRAMLAALASAVSEVEGFVKDNRGLLKKDLAALGDVAGTLAKEKESLALALEKGPLGAGNLAIAFDNKTGSIGGRIAVGPNADDTDGFLCSVVQQARIPSRDLACKVFEQLLERLPDGTFPPGGDSSELPSGSSQRLGSLPPATTLRELLGGRR
jgi:phospholipid/cholesterol/gamma-HCH transport system substrate-binding protein